MLLLGVLRLVVRVLVEGVLDHHVISPDPPSVNVSDGLIGFPFCLVVDETMPLGVAAGVSRDSAGADPAAEAEGVVKGGVVDSGVEVADADAPFSAMLRARVVLEPRDAAGAPVDTGVVQHLEGSLCVVGVVEMDVRVSIALGGQAMKELH